VAPGDPVTFLVVGTDRREAAAGGRADTIGLVRVDPGAGELRLLTVPRDLLLTADGAPEERAAQVFHDRGAGGLVQGIQHTLGVEVHHYVQVDLPGAVELVDALGGVRVELDRGYRDDDSGLAPLAAGCHELDGTTVLALARSRKGDVQQDDGGWAPDGGAVFGRDARGAAIAAALIQTVGRAGVAELPGLIDAGLASVVTDDNLGTGELEGWVREARDDRFVPFGLPTAGSPPEAPAALVLDEGAAGVVAAFVDGGSDPVLGVVDGTPLVEATGLRPC
jgi:LCP family protein required for cell wall assembly